MGTKLSRADARLLSARRGIVRGAAAGLGMALLAPMLAAAPAQADLLDSTTDLLTGEVLEPVVDTTTGVVTDPATGDLVGVLEPGTGELLLAPVPAIESGAGQILVLVNGVMTPLCDSADEVCDPVPLDTMVDEAAVVLKAVPATPGDIPAWDPAGCTQVIADICMIAIQDLAGDTPLAPAVGFLTGSSDSGAPDTEITSPVPGKRAQAHTFTFRAEPATDQTTFACKLEVSYKSTPPAGAQRSHDWQPCGAEPVGEHRYEKLANGTYVFAVQALEGDAADDTPATQSWTVAVPPEVPETRIVAGPKGGSWLLARRAAFKFRSSVEGSDFQCSYDSMTDACDSGAFVWGPRKHGAPLRPGTHVFKVAALANKTQDFSPAVRRFHVPLDDRGMRPVKNWTRKKQRGHLKNTYTQTTVKGAALITKRKQKFRRVVLVADKGRGFGTVQIFWGKRMLREVSLEAKKPLVKRKVIPVRKFNGKLRSGKLRVVVTSAGKPVRIDGIGLAKR